MSAARTMNAAWPSSDDYASRARRVWRWTVGASAASAVVYAAGLLATGGDPILLAPLAGALVVAAVLVRPVAGLYMVFAAVLLFEQFDVPGISPLTSQTHFYQNISAFTPIPLRLSACDLLIALTLASAAVRHLILHDSTRRGPFAAAVTLYAGAFGIGTVIGIVRGGAWDASAMLAELRGPLYVALLYFLTVDLIRERAQLRVLLWSFVALVATKALQGIANYVTTSGVALEAVTAHEDVIFFNAAIALAVASLVIGRHSKMSYALVAAAPAILLAELVTQRRVGFIGLAIVLLAVVILSLAREPRRAFGLVALGVVAVGAYVPLFWDASGAVAEPIRALRTVLDDPTVTVRDQLSDRWREIEDRNIEFTMRQVPLTGVGLGQQYLFQEEPPLPSATFVYWRYMTHNAVLWVWLKAGPIGAFALFFLVARVLLVSSVLFVRLRDAELRLAAALMIALVIAQVIFSSVELGLTYSRTMIVLGVALGMAAVLSEAAARDAATRPMRAVVA
jgi:hypothetical protein